MIFEGVTIRL